MAHDCRICGEHEKNTYMTVTAELLEVQQLCFTCSFWMEKLYWRADHDKHQVIIDGTHFYIGEEIKPDNGRLDNPYRWAGHGGSKFVIEWLNPNRKERVVTRNLWCQGKIPEHFRKFLPDNARFVKE